MKTGREAGGGKWVFLEINDGTSFQSLQAGHPCWACWADRKLVLSYAMTYLSTRQAKDA